MRQIEPLARFLVAQLAVSENQVPKGAVFYGAMGAPHVLIAVNDGDLADDGAHTRIDGRENERVAARIGNTPHAKAVGVYDLVALEEAQGVLVVPNLGPGVEMLAVVAIAHAEIAIVKDQGVDARLRKSLRVDRHDDFADVTPAAGQHDCRRAVGFVSQVEPTPNRGALGLKFD